MFLNTVIVEAHLARGMSIDYFAPNPSSSSNGLDAEYSVIGRSPGASGRWRCGRSTAPRPARSS